MPLYEYKCEECGLRFERRQRFSDDPVKICPDCGGDVIRLIQPAGIIFKGSGFYVTDNRSKSSTAIPGNRKDQEKHEGARSSEAAGSSEAASSSEAKESSTSSSSSESKSSDRGSDKSKKERS